MSNDADIAAAWNRELPGAPTRSIGAVSAIKAAATRLVRERERTLRALGIDAATLDLVSVLRRSGPPYVLSTRELTERTLVTAGAISQRLARAERDDLVVRRPAEHGRAVLVELTPAGHALAEGSVAQVLAVDDDAVAGLDDHELALLRGLLERVAPPTGVRERPVG